MRDLNIQLAEALGIIKAQQKQIKLLESIILKQGERIAQLEERVKELEGKQKTKDKRQKTYRLLSSQIKLQSLISLAGLKVMQVFLDLYLIMLMKKLIISLIVAQTVATA